MDTTKEWKTAFNYFGGKTRHLDFILPVLNVTHNHYIETCCGSAAVFLNKIPSPIETINDIDGRIVNFFKVLRTRPGELIQLLELTPYARQEFNESAKYSDDELEEARLFFIRVMQSFGGAGHGRSKLTSWRSAKTESRKGTSCEVSKWWTKIEGLGQIVERLKMAQIENRPAVKIIETYDRPDALFYSDPPYPHESRTAKTDYRFEMTNEDHKNLAEAHNNCVGKVVVSGYDCDLMNELYPPEKWFKKLGPKRMSNLGLKETREVVWCNFNPDNHKKLF